MLYLNQPTQNKMPQKKCGRREKRKKPISNCCFAKESSRVLRLNYANHTVNLNAGENAIHLRTKAIDASAEFQFYLHLLRSLITWHRSKGISYEPSQFRYREMAR